MSVGIEPSHADFDELVATVRAEAPDASDRMRETLAARRDRRGGHAGWGALCEEVGEG